MSKALFNLKITCAKTLLNHHLGVFVRNGHHLRGKAPGIARSLEQRLQEINYKDPTLNYRVDISLAPPLFDKKLKEERLKHLKEQRKNLALEKASRNKTLNVDIEKVFEDWSATVGSQQIKTIADHYGIYQDLYGDAYFYPRVPLNVQFKSEINSPVYFGNVIHPKNAQEKPEVSFESDKDTFWTLLLTNPDTNFTDNNSEYVHWFVGNIPGNSIEKGELLFKYLQPFPPRGTGYHRFIFVLYKQNKKLNFDQYKSNANEFDLMSRNFSTLNFYRNYQDDLTPASLVFFQSEWDKSLTEFYHHKLQMQEPIFEYDFDPPYIRPQKWFPIKQPFNLYMDKYRDPKQINKEFLERKLKNVHPFKDPPAPLPFPNAVRFDKYTPSWLKLEKTKSKLK